MHKSLDKVILSGVDDLPKLEDYQAYLEQCHEDGATPMTKDEFTAAQDFREEYNNMTSDEKTALYED